MRFLLPLLLITLAGCAAAPGTVPPMQGHDYVITLTDDYSFDPKEARVPLGANVTWHNGASMDHDVAVYYGDPPEDQPRWSSSMSGHLISPGQNVTYTFQEKGTWTIWCHTHHEQRMKQLIHVD